MRRSRSTLLSLSNLSTLILSILVFSILGFAAAPDRIGGPIVSSQLVRLSAGVPMKARPQYDQGPVDPSLRLGYMTLLTAPSASQQKAINQLLAQQQDPHSPQYHQWLTPEQYADRFGLSSNDIQKLTTWLQSQGFTVVRVARARNFIVFSGTAAQAETAFQTQIHNFDINGEKRFSNITPPSVPAALTGIVTGIRGLSNFPAKSHALHAKPDYSAPGTSLTGDRIAPGDITTMYDLQKLYNAGITGTGYSLAVIGETDVYLADLNDFRTIFDLPQQISGCTFFSGTNVIQTCDTTNFKYVVVMGDVDPGVPDSYQSGDLVEADVDLEWSNAVAQDAKIIYVNAPDPNGNGIFDSWYFAIDNNISPVITLSYGLCELVEANSGYFLSDEGELASAQTYGITFMNSSGDDGATECEPNNYGDPNGTLATLGLAVSYPASSQYVTGVGGTMIPDNEYTSTYWSTTNGSTGGSVIKYIPEQGWNDDQEWGAYCVANPSYRFCTNYGITSWQTAQAALAITAGGGGASNCTNISSSTGDCISGSAQPSYQAGLSLTDLGQTTAVRFSPDVSLLASVFWPGFIVCTPVNEILGNGDTNSLCANGLTGASGFFSYGYTFGGTSIAAPMFAGIVTLLNQDVVQSGLQTTPGLGNINPTLYTLAATPANGAFNLLASSTSTGSNGAYCQTGMPNFSDWPPALVCPAAVAPATEGFLGYSASKFDATTNYNLVTGLGSVDAFNLAAAWVTAGKATTATTVTSSQSPQAYGSPVTFTATVTTSGSTAPTGTVTFNDGTTQLGTGTLSNVSGSQEATFTTPALSPGDHSITAVYGGDTSNEGSTSDVLTQTVTPATFTFISTGGPSHTVLAGQTTLMYTFTATPTSGATFVSAVNVGCSFSPADPTLTSSVCSYSVNGGAMQSGSATIPAGSHTSTVAVTVTTSGPNSGAGSQFRHRSDNRLPWLPLTLPLAGVVMVGLAGRKMSRVATVSGMCLMLVLAGFLIACGSSSPPPISIASVTGSSANIYPQNVGWTNATATFTAVLNNDSANKGVTWAVSTANGGTIAATDPTHATYTPPTIAAGLPSNVTITATSVADTTKTGTASIALNPTTVPIAAPGYTVTVTASETGATAPQAANVTLVVN